MALHCKGELDVKEFVLIKVYFNNIVLVCHNYKEHLPSIHIVLSGIPVFLVWYGIRFRPVLLYKDTVSRYFN